MPRLDIEIRTANASDLPVAIAWLAGEGLPSDDLTRAHMDAFLFAMDGDTPVGMIGIERFGDAGLLRSLLVDRNRRGIGLGRQLVTALEAAAYRDQISEMWLLTIDADRFFARLGYRAVDRAAAPETVQGTAEFSDLCPADAVLMQKKLG